MLLFGQNIILRAIYFTTKDYLTSVLALNVLSILIAGIVLGAELAQRETSNAPPSPYTMFFVLILVASMIWIIWRDVTRGARHLAPLIALFNLWPPIAIIRMFYNWVELIEFALIISIVALIFTRGYGRLYHQIPLILEGIFLSEAVALTVIVDKFLEIPPVVVGFAALTVVQLIFFVISAWKIRRGEDLTPLVPESALRTHMGSLALLSLTLPTMTLKILFGGLALIVGLVVVNTTRELRTFARFKPTA